MDSNHNPHAKQLPTDLGAPAFVDAWRTRALVAGAVFAVIAVIPSVAILRDGKLVYLMQRAVIEQSTAQEIAGELMRAFDAFCAKATA